MRGLKKSIEQHKAEGTFRSNEHGNKGMPGELVHTAIPAPAHMNDNAKKIWEQVLPIIQKGQVFNTDLFALEVLCTAMADYRYCAKKIYDDNYEVVHTNNDGATNTTRHYLATDKKQNYDILQQMFSRFGLTPTDRAKVFMIQDRDDVDELDGLV